MYRVDAEFTSERVIRASGLVFDTLALLEPLDLPKAYRPMLDDLRRVQADLAHCNIALWEAVADTEAAGA